MKCISNIFWLYNMWHHLYYCHLVLTNFYQEETKSKEFCIKIRFKLTSFLLIVTWFTTNTWATFYNVNKTNSNFDLPSNRRQPKSTLSDETFFETVAGPQVLWRPHSKTHRHMIWQAKCRNSTYGILMRPLWLFFECVGGQDGLRQKCDDGLHVAKAKSQVCWLLRPMMRPIRSIASTECASSKEKERLSAFRVEVPKLLYYTTLRSIMFVALFKWVIIKQK